MIKAEDLAKYMLLKFRKTLNIHGKVKNSTTHMSGNITTHGNHVRQCGLVTKQQQDSDHRLPQPTLLSLGMA